MKIKEWDGSGVPPVGMVCEYRLDEDSAWFKCKIMYVLSGSDHCFVAWCDHLGSDQILTFASNSYELQLRKIKTPEQIAAEERLHAIDEMIELVAGDSSFNEVMSILYDAGYRKNEADKPLTVEELKAGWWWCADVSKECANALKSKNLRVFNSDGWGRGRGRSDGLWVGCAMDIRGDVERKGIFFDFAGKKQIHRIGNEFYWVAVVSCDFDHCKNEAVGMVNDTEEALSDNGCRNFKIHSKHFYCNQHMRESINYG